MIISLNRIFTQTTGPIALKFTETSGLGFKLGKFFKKLINNLINLIKIQSIPKNAQ